MNTISNLRETKIKFECRYCGEKIDKEEYEEPSEGVVISCVFCGWPLNATEDALEHEERDSILAKGSSFL